jgi:GrpB-like predicted nucleotidyltransferase (UPF0157 family)
MFTAGPSKKLILLPHDPMWAESFATEKTRIVTAVGDQTMRIEHVGSTAIPSVHAKPVLDLAIVCGEQGIDALALCLTSLGYDYRGQFDDETGHFYAVRDRDGVRFCQAHIYENEHPDFHLKLLFRDVLRRNAELAREYNEYKLSLAKTISDKSVYAEIKTRWVDGFIKKVIDD